GTLAAEYAVVAAVVTGTAIVARIVWVTGASWFSRWRCRGMTKGEVPASAIQLSPKAAAVVAWCGMRGTVTRAAALARPVDQEGGGAFPYRDLIIVAAFGVTLGTLVLQGLTLRPLIVKLGLEDDGSIEREVRLARAEGLRAAVAATAACG